MAPGRNKQNQYLRDWIVMPAFTMRERPERLVADPLRDNRAVTLLKPE
jgi:hypothetical protein